MRFFGASDATADKWSGILYGGAMIAGAPGSGMAVRGVAGAVGAARGATAARSTVATAGGSAQNIANGPRLAHQLSLESANSAFAADGTLSEGAIQNSQQIFAPGTLSNPAIPSGLGKYTTQTYSSPSGPFQVHFYMDPLSLEPYYGADYKAIFNSPR
jgi:hypothetical protein